MIKNKMDYHEYINSDMHFYNSFSRRERIILWLTHDPAYNISKYIKFLRKEEYYSNCRKDKFGQLCGLLFFRRKNKLGNKLGFKIPKNTFEQGLTIYHHGMIIVNENARIGKNAKLHGGNCIGNDGSSEEAPFIGDGLDLGFGAMIIGAVELGKNVRVGAGAIVTKSFGEDSILLVGIPAKKV